VNEAAPSEGRPRIGFFQPYPGRLYGSQRLQLQLMEGVRRFGIDPVLLVTAEGPVADAGRSAGIPVAVLTPPPPLDRYGRVLLADGFRAKVRIAVALAVYTLRLSRVLRRQRIRVLHANQVRAARWRDGRPVGWACRWCHTTTPTKAVTCRGSRSRWPTAWPNG
jgi:hypothetical protein